MRIPLADWTGLGRGVRRAWLIRLLLAGALASLLAGAFAAVPGGAGRRTERDGRIMVVLDVSGSIENNDFPAVDRALERVAREARAGGAGLVLFSDTAEEALPPGTPVGELLRFRRFFSSKAGGGQPENGILFMHRRSRKASGATTSTSSDSNLNPWQPHFSAGTAISTGVARARVALRGKGRLILISDFVDSTWDRSKLRKELLAVARTPGLELEPIPLPAVLPGSAAPYLHLIERTVPRAAVATPAPTRTTGTAFPGWLVVLGALLAAALAANELLAVSLRFREARA